MTILNSTELWEDIRDPHLGDLYYNLTGRFPNIQYLYASFTFIEPALTFSAQRYPGVKCWISLRELSCHNDSILNWEEQEEGFVVTVKDLKWSSLQKLCLTGGRRLPKLVAAIAPRLTSLRSLTIHHACWCLALGGML